MTGKELATKAIDIARNYKTLYVMGCFGSPMTEANKRRFIDVEHWGYNNKAARQQMIISASPDTFGFDCCNLIKAILWGWNGDTGHNYGGAKYESNGVPDSGADKLMSACWGQSMDFSAIAVGEFLWMKGHCGVYIGGGLAVECTPKWANGVQITAVGNVGGVLGYNTRTWTKHGFLPYVGYTDIKREEEKDVPEKRFNRVDELPTWAQPTVVKLILKGAIRGNSGERDANGYPVDMDLSTDMVRMFVINERLGLY